MAHLGKDVSEKHLSKVSNHLVRWLDTDEKVIALLRASRMKPQIDGLILTNHRVLTISGLSFGDIKVVDEVAADDILKLAFEKGFGKSIKIFVEKKNGEKAYLGIVGGDMSGLSGLVSTMHGAPQPIADKLSLAKQAEVDARKLAVIKKAQEDKANQVRKKEEEQASKLVKQERKEAEATRIKARGKKLGYVFVKYVGGYDPQYKKTFFEGWLNCYENELEYKGRNISVSADQIVSFEITGKEQTSTTSRLTVTRMVTLGIFSLAAPKHKTKTKKEATIYVGLKDGRQLMFQTDNLTESDVHRKLASAISHYSSLQARQVNPQQSLPTQTLDVAGEIARFSDLKKQGILTNDEFEAKKKQLLNL
jgi:hypothetical protein